MQQIIRHGAYGVLIQNSQILLTQKKSGAYQGLWGLPGGGIEFGETPKETLKRELIEESCIIASELEFFTIATSTGQYDNDGIFYGLHHIGILYKVLSWKKQLDLIPQEENRWFMLNRLSKKELTPFALYAISI